MPHERVRRAAREGRRPDVTMRAAPSCGPCSIRRIAGSRCHTCASTYPPNASVVMKKPIGIRRVVRDARARATSTASAERTASTRLADRAGVSQPAAVAAGTHQQREHQQRPGDLADLGGRDPEQHEEHDGQRAHRARRAPPRRPGRPRRTAAVGAMAASTASRTTTATASSTRTCSSVMPRKLPNSSDVHAAEEAAVQADEEEARRPARTPAPCR